MNGIADLYKLADVTAGKPSPMMLFPIGNWTSAKYPELTLDQALADEVIANFEAKVLRTKVPVDTNHDPQSPANGWHERLYMAPFEWGGVSGDALYADWIPNERGAQVVNGGEYAYDSVDIGDHVDPVTGNVYHNVLKATTLSNRPVLRMMPGIRDAADALKLSEPVDIQLSEISLASVAPSVTSILDDMDALAEKLDAQLKGKAGMPAMRTMLKEVRTKASAHTFADEEDPEDDGSPAVPTGASSEPASQDAKGDEGQPVTLAEGDAATKGSDPMKTVALKLNLAEDASEEIVLAEVVKLSDERDAAVAKLAEVEKAKRDAEIEATLTELVDGGHVLPGQKEAWTKLAEDSPESFAVFAVNAKKVKAIELGEVGTSEGSETPSDDPTVELDNRAKKLAEDRSIPYGDAMSLALAEDPALAGRYSAREL